MSWVALGTSALGAVGSLGGGGSGGGGVAAGVPGGPVTSGGVNHAPFSVGGQTKGLPAWVILSALGLVVVGFIAWLSLGSRKR